MSDSASVRRVLDSWAEGFVDRDGKFVSEFQTTFNSCFWELYLFSVLKHIGIEVDFRHNAPDFVTADGRLAIEAAIASHAAEDIAEWEKTHDMLLDPDIDGARTRSIIRASNAFHSKYNKYMNSYRQLEHMEGRPYVIAIANYGTPDFFLLGDVAMQWLLYDVAEVGAVQKPNGAEVPLGLFRNSRFSKVSAVIYSSVATFGKARALGDDTDDFIFWALRIKDNLYPIRISAKKSEYSESLTDGLRLFTNPFAENPLDLEMFGDPGIRVFDADTDGNFLVSCHPDGDLCMRMVHHLKLSTAEEIEAMRMGLKQNHLRSSGG